MIHCIRLHPNEMSERDKRKLISFAKWDGAKRTTIEIIELVLQEIYQMWRMKGEGVDLLLVTRVIGTKRGGRTLYVEAIAGDGFSRHYQGCCDALVELAREGNCNSVTGWVHRPGMVMLIEKGGLPIVASVFMREVSDNAIQG